MNKIKLLIAAVMVSMALAACNRADNPIEPTPEYNVDEPQEQVTDQPAN